jgi:hypothetical protein
MSLQVGVNSYIDYDTAEVYFSDRLYADDWNSSSQSSAEKALIMATQRIETLPLAGVKADITQILHFPIKTRYYSTSTVPKAVLNAVCEEALAILGGVDKRAKLQASGVQSYSVGGLSEAFDHNGYAYTGLQSAEARRLLQPYLGSVEIC